MKVIEQKKIRWWFVILSVLEIPLLVGAFYYSYQQFFFCSNGGPFSVPGFSSCSSLLLQTLVISWSIASAITYVLVAMDVKWAIYVNTLLLGSVIILLLPWLFLSIA